MFPYLFIRIVSIKILYVFIMVDNYFHESLDKYVKNKVFFFSENKSN